MSETPDVQIEERIIEALEIYGPQPRRLLQGRCRDSRWSSRDFALAFEAMVKNEAINKTSDDIGRILYTAAAQEDMEGGPMISMNDVFTKITEEREKGEHIVPVAMIHPETFYRIFREMPVGAGVIRLTDRSGESIVTSHIGVDPETVAFL